MNYLTQTKCTVDIGQCSGPYTITNSDHLRLWSHSFSTNYYIKIYLYIYTKHYRVLSREQFLNFAWYFCHAFHWHTNNSKVQCSVEFLERRLFFWISRRESKERLLSECINVLMNFSLFFPLTIIWTRFVFLLSRRV